MSFETLQLCQFWSYSFNIWNGERYSSKAVNACLRFLIHWCRGCTLVFLRTGNLSNWIGSMFAKFFVFSQNISKNWCNSFFTQNTNKRLTSDSERPTISIHLGSKNQFAKCKNWKMKFLGLNQVFFHALMKRAGKTTLVVAAVLKAYSYFGNFK